MTLAQLLTLVANRLDDTKEPYLWSDEELTSYANQRINEVCEEVPALRDASTASICSIPIIAGTTLYATDPRIIYILEAKLASEALPLSRMTYQELLDSNPTSTSTAAIPRAFMTDYEADRILLDTQPLINDTLSLRVIRYPLVPLDYTLAESMTPELPSRMHERLIPGITSLAYRKADAETEDLKRAKEDLAEWMLNLEWIRQFYLKLHYSPTVAVPHQAFL